MNTSNQFVDGLILGSKVVLKLMKRAIAGYPALLLNNDVIMAENAGVNPEKITTEAVAIMMVVAILTIASVPFWYVSNL